MTGFDEMVLGGGPGNWYGDRYTIRHTGYFVPPITGWYTFWGHSDDTLELHFSPVAEGSASETCGTPTLEKMFTSGCCSGIDLNNSKNKFSRKLELDAGKSYAFDARYYEGTHHGYFDLGFIYHGTNEAYNIGSHGPLSQNKGLVKNNYCSI